jgi:hypothetical protein
VLKLVLLAVLIVIAVAGLIAWVIRIFANAPDDKQDP